MKILVFSLAFEPMIGGAEIALKELTKRLKNNFDFTIICARFDKRLEEYEEINSIPVYRVGRGNILDKYFYPIYALQKSLSLGKFNGAWAMMENYALIAAFFYYLRTGTNYLLSLQSGDSDFKLWSRVWFIYPLYVLAHKKAKIVQAISEFLARRAEKFGCKGKVKVIPNGVDLEIFKKSGEELDSENIRIISVSRLVEKNSINTLIKSLSLLPKNYSLILVGDGPDRRELESLAEKFNLNGRVKFQGSLPQDQVAQYLRQSHVFVRPSRSEGMGNAFIEAMASGVPVVGTLVGGIKDFLVDGKTGLVAKVDDPESVAKAILRLTENRVLREKIVNNGHELSKSYSWDKIALSMGKLLENVCES